MNETLKRILLIYGVALTVLVGVFVVTSQAKASDLPAIAASTFKLYEGDRGICSTTFLRNDKDGAMFLTAAHCVDGTGLNVREQTLDQKDLKTVLSEEVFYVKAIRTLKKLDVAILQTMDKSATFTAPGVDIAAPAEANEALKFGDKLIVVGYPAAEALSVTEGPYTGTVPVPGAVANDLDAPMYQTTVPVAGGNSGGGLYARIADTWKLIGTVTAKRMDNDIMTFYQTAETVDTVLKGYVSSGTYETKRERPSQMGIDQR